MAAVDVVGAVGGDDHEPAAAQGAEEVGEQVPGGGVRPVQVLQDEHDRAVGGEPLQQPDGQFEEAGGAVLVGGLAAAGVAQFGQQPGELVLLAVGRGGEFLGQPPAQGAQGGGEGGEGQSVGADLHAAAERRRRRPRAQAASRNSSMSRVLPTPASPPMSSAWGSPAVGAGERVGEGGQFAGAADEHGTD